MSTAHQIQQTDQLKPSRGGINNKSCECSGCIVREKKWNKKKNNLIRKQSMKTNGGGKRSNISCKCLVWVLHQPKWHNIMNYVLLIHAHCITKVISWYKVKICKCFFVVSSLLMRPELNLILNVVLDSTARENGPLQAPFISISLSIYEQSRFYLDFRGLEKLSLVLLLVNAHASLNFATKF